MSKSPLETLQILDKVSVKKHHETWDQTLVLGFLAGAFIAFGGLLAFSVGGSVPGLKETNPGLQKLLFGGVFPVGIILTLFTGSSLFTGNVLAMFTGLLNRSVSLLSLLRTWTLSFIGNLLGSLFVAYFLTYLLFDEEDTPWISEVRYVAAAKMNKNAGKIFLSGIACNWLVGLSVYFYFAATSFTGKVVGMWWPIMAFVAIGFEHCVANMFFLPAGLMYSAPDSAFWKLVVNIIMATLGNIFGGALFASGLLWYPHVFRKEHSVASMYSTFRGALHRAKKEQFGNEGKKDDGATELPAVKVEASEVIANQQSGEEEKKGAGTDLSAVKVESSEVVANRQQL